MSAPVLDKDGATLQAVAALAGIAVTPIEGDDGSTVFIVSWKSLTRACATLEEVRSLLARMGIEA